MSPGALEAQTRARSSSSSGVTLVVDPGVRKAGASLWAGQDLLKAATLRAPEGDLGRVVAGWSGAVGEVIAEEMVCYRLRRRPHEDLARVEAMVRDLEAALGLKARRVRPSAWKGSAPKAIIRRRLEEAGFDVQGLGHDAVDAVGIGAVALGVLRRGCIAP